MTHVWDTPHTLRSIRTATSRDRSFLATGRRGRVSDRCTVTSRLLRFGEIGSPKELNSCRSSRTFPQSSPRGAKGHDEWSLERQKFLIECPQSRGVGVEQVEESPRFRSVWEMSFVFHQDQCLIGVPPDHFLSGDPSSVSGRITQGHGRVVPS